MEQTMSTDDQQLLRELNNEVMLSSGWDRKIERENKAHNAIVTAAKNSEIASQNSEKWEIEDQEAFMSLFRELHNESPFCSKSKLNNNGEMVFVSDGNIMLFLADGNIQNNHVHELLMCLISFGRHVHLNIGTPGAQDGSTSFQISAKTLNWLKANETNRKQWVESALTLTNSDIQTIEQTIMLLGRGTVSITFVDSATKPAYPEHCDVINAWCYSGNIPKQPESEKLQNDFSYQLKDICLQDLNRKNDEHAGILTELLQAQVKAKKQNMFCILINALKELGVPESCVKLIKAKIKQEFIEFGIPKDKLKEIINQWNLSRKLETYSSREEQLDLVTKPYYVENLENISSDDQRWNSEFLLIIMKPIVKFMDKFYQGESEHNLYSYLDLTHVRVLDQSTHWVTQMGIEFGKVIMKRFGDQMTRYAKPTGLRKKRRPKRGGGK